MRKQIKKWGNSGGILLSSENLKLYGLNIGDIVDISDMVKFVGTKKKKEVGTKKKKQENVDDLLKRLPQ